MITWLRQSTNLRPMSNETGVYSFDPPDVTAAMVEATRRNLRYQIWFTPDGTGSKNRAVGLVNADASLRLTGAALKSFAAAPSTDFVISNRAIGSCSP